MFRDNRIIRLILTAAVIVAIAASLLLFATLKKERDEKAALQNELAQVMKERKRLSVEVEELKLIKGDLEIKLNGIEAQAKILAENYEKEKTQNDVVRVEIRKKTEEIKTANTKLKSLQGENKKLQAMVNGEKAKYGELKERVDNLANVKDKLEEKVKEIINKQGIELERIVVKAEGELEGKVLVVNREYNFIVVDIGIRDDVQLGDILTIFRNGRYIGEANVEKLYDTMAAATIAREVQPNSIMVSDNVVVRDN